MFFYSALIVGLLGSFHCAGMCGPLALALPLNRENKFSFYLNIFAYNFGRIFTYSVLGLLAGLIGHRIAMAGFQKGLSVFSGLAIIAITLFSLYSTKILAAGKIISSYSNTIKSIFKKLFSKTSAMTRFLIGTANGLLPCGFVYLALAAALATGDYLESAGYMFFFGLGTLPMMFGFSYAGSFFGPRFLKFFRKATPYLALLVGILLIYRGIYVVNHSCCHK